MIVGTLNKNSTQQLLRNHHVWARAFDWINEKAQDVNEGIHPLGLDERLFARVMSYDLKPRMEATYEAHRETIDLQVTIFGVEGIEYTPVTLLKPKGEYSVEKEVQHYHTPAAGYAMIANHPGQFCILFPEDGHMPQLATADCTHVKKLVVKIPTRLVGRWES